MFEVTFRKTKVTPGAVKYQEVNDAGLPLDMQSAKIGTLYIRKTAFVDIVIPEQIKVTVS